MSAKLADNKTLKRANQCKVTQRSIPNLAPRCKVREFPVGFAVYRANEDREFLFLSFFAVKPPWQQRLIA